MVFVICAAVVIVVLLVFFNANANRIRKINNIINKDRSVCDFIISLNGWNISPVKVDGLRIVIIPIGMPVYDLYITYDGHWDDSLTCSFNFSFIVSPLDYSIKISIPFA